MSSFGDTEYIVTTGESTERKIIAMVRADSAVQAFAALDRELSRPDAELWVRVSREWRHHGESRRLEDEVDHQVDRIERKLDWLHRWSARAMLEAQHGQTIGGSEWPGDLPPSNSPRGTG